MNEGDLYAIISKYFETYEIKNRCREINRIDSSIDIDDIKQDVFMKLYSKMDLMVGKEVGYVIVAIDNSLNNIYRYVSKNYRRKSIPNIKGVIGSDLMSLFDMLEFNDEQRRLFLFCSKSCSSNRLMIPDSYRQKGNNVLNSKFRDEVVEIIKLISYVFGDEYMNEYQKHFFGAMLEKKDGARVKLTQYPILKDLYQSNGRNMVHNSCIKVLRELFLDMVDFLEKSGIIKIRKL